MTDSESNDSISNLTELDIDPTEPDTHPPVEQ